MRQLRLVHDADAVEPVKDPSTFDQAWALRKGQMRTRGDGREKTRKLWIKAEGKVGSAGLLAALQRYLREEKEPTCGYPGLSVWLNGERYDHWLQVHVAIDPTQPETPAALRSRLVAALEEPFVRSYLDPCEFLPDGWIIPRTEYARKKLLEVKHVLKAAGIAGMKKRE